MPDIDSLQPEERESFDLRLIKTPHQPGFQDDFKQISGKSYFANWQFPSFQKITNWLKTNAAALFAATAGALVAIGFLSRKTSNTDAVSMKLFGNTPTSPQLPAMPGFSQK